MQHSPAVHGSVAQVMFAGLAIGCWLLFAQVVKVSHVGSEAERGEAVKNMKYKKRQKKETTSRRTSAFLQHLNAGNTKRGSFTTCSGGRGVPLVTLHPQNSRAGATVAHPRPHERPHVCRCGALEGVLGAQFPSIPQAIFKRAEK